MDASLILSVAYQVSGRDVHPSVSAVIASSAQRLIFALEFDLAGASPVSSEVS